MNMFEEARSLRGMLNMRGISQTGLAKLLGVSQPYIANKIRLLGFSEKMQDLILESGISERHARTLLKLPEEMRIDGLKKVTEGKMSVIETEVMTDLMLEENNYRRAYHGINVADKIGRFEELLEGSISNLGLFGIKANLKREKYHGKTYITICIE